MKLSTALPFLLSVAASPVFVSSSKSSKSNADCPPPTQEVSCGDVYESGEVITLGGDVLCEGNITEAVGVSNAGITVRGEGTVIDCNGFSIRQKTDSSAAAVDCKVWPVHDATQILLMKETCDLYYMWGIKVENGATVKNCNVQQFWGGAEIKDGGTVLNSDFSLNYIGVEVRNEKDNTQSNVKSSSFYNNGIAGLLVYQSINNGEAVVNIEDVRAMNTNRTGILVSGTNITIRNADAPNNVFAGLEIFRSSSYPDQLTDITLEGQVTLNNNANNGFIGYIGSPVGTVKVSGNLFTNGNKYDGVYLGNSKKAGTDLNVVLDDGSSSGKSGKTSSSGTITSCNNGQTFDDPEDFGDIRNYGSGTFEGTDYTCDNTGGTGDVPVCTPCYPNCVSHPEDNGTRSLMTGQHKFDDVMDITEIEL